MHWLQVTPNKQAYSETFIAAHRTMLPVPPSAIWYGGWFPQFSWPDSALYAPQTHAIAQRIENWTGVKLFFHRENSLYRQLRRRGITHILAEYGPTGCSMLPIAERANCPMVVHFHGLDAFHQDILTTWQAGYQRLSQHRLVRLVVPSQDMRCQLTDALGCASHRIHVIPYGIDLTYFTPQPRHQASARPTIELLAVGRFVEKKAPYLTLVAFANAFARNPALRLTYVGDGPLLEIVQRLATVYRLEHVIRFLVPQPPEVIRTLLQESDIFVQHSVTTHAGDSEGLPLSILEAQAMAVPVISTYHAGIPETITDGENGYLVRQNDTDTMAERILTLAADPGLRQRMGVAARQNVELRHGQLQFDRLWQVLSGQNH
jgi:glycosyltransferase involved in cell wall biosynthesis